jgi:hypothetical protein
MGAQNIDPMFIKVCPVTDEGCESWTIASDDPTNPVDYSIMRELQDPYNEEAAREIGRICWSDNVQAPCATDAMRQLLEGPQNA